MLSTQCRQPAVLGAMSISHSFFYRPPATPVTPVGPVPSPEAAWVPYPSIAEASLAYALGATWTTPLPSNAESSAWLQRCYSWFGSRCGGSQATMTSWTKFCPTTPSGSTSSSARCPSAPCGTWPGPRTGSTTCRAFYCWTLWSTT